MIQVLDMMYRPILRFESIARASACLCVEPDEIVHSLRTGLATGGYFFDFSDDFLRDCYLNSIVEAHGPMTTRQIADMMGLSTGHVSNVINAALAKLKGSLVAKELLLD